MYNHCPLILQRVPAKNAIAIIKGNEKYPNIKGTVYFSRVPLGTSVIVRVTGLPKYKPPGTTPQIGPHGFHIHSGSSCQNPDGHWNPDGQPHGNHAGDFPVLFSQEGIGYMSFITKRFTPDAIIGKTVVIHSGPDDYKTQPSGGSGTVIACGEIKISR